MAVLAGGQVPGGAPAAAIRSLPPPLRYIFVSGYERSGHGSREAAGKMAAVSAPYAKYPPPPPLRPPGGKGKRVGFKPPPPPAQTPSSLSVSVSRARHRRDHRPCDPPDSGLLSPRPDRLRPQGAHIPAQRLRKGTPAPDRPNSLRRRSLSPGAAGQPTARPSLSYPQNTGVLHPPLPLNRALPLPFAARGGVPNRAPMPPPRAPSRFRPHRNKPYRAASILKNDVYLRNRRQTCPGGDPDLGLGGPVLGDGAQRRPSLPPCGRRRWQRGQEDQSTIQCIRKGTKEGSIRVSHGKCSEAAHSVQFTRKFYFAVMGETFLALCECRKQRLRRDMSTL
ncbi:uncharacterized protein [Melanerpes formicivorus]|uniref:uncharacterized protein isoform X2 n=1 Tax=Melanerpes formicivorus TaxID=211600 RepID=UPI00358FA4F9